MKNKKKIFITGGTGYIGSHFLNLANKNYEVFCFSRSAPKTKNIEWIQGDLTNLSISKLPKKIDYIIHLAQSSKYHDAENFADDILKVNTLSTFNLLEYGKKIGIKKFIYASTGNIDNYYDNFYIATKYMSELLISHYKKCFIPIILRLYTVYGPNQKDRLIPNLIDKIKKNKIITLENTCEGIKLTPTYISDAIEAIYKSLELQNACSLNIAGKETVSIKHLSLLIGKLLRKKLKFKKTVNKKAGNLIADAKRLKFPSKISLCEGLKLSI